ncbi:hypothetical protein NONO_c48110 [Nocardia nova SH22a]|uniref:Transmembrane protein n=1 Tax=Nocardia nova SH22a TaxID=1415166 RepID=W5TJR0_9NOCA|nr:hypothetical protein [Nocardia nova]AHH19595.1 hypothetical protein NONO_c48110 [Nocardia nova SH22a]
MKTTTRGVAATTLVATALVAAAAGAHADTTTPPSQWSATDLAPGVRYTDDTATGTAALQTPLGAVAIRPGQFDLRDATGATLLGTPIQVPAPTADATRAPESAAAQVDSAPATPPGGDQLSDLDQAVKAASPHMGMGMAVGSMAGSVVGALLGCPLGMATGGTLVSLASAGTLSVPAMAAACLVGVVAVGGLGASVGGAAVAIPVGIAAGTQKYNQLQAEHARERSAPPVG